MIIEKIAKDKKNMMSSEYYYDSAREGMLDLLDNMKNAEMINTLFLPGYIGWSPKEGSGIFDPVSNIQGLNVEYYKLTSDLSIDVQDLSMRIKRFKNRKFAVLTVNYFGFRDEKVKEVTNIIKSSFGWIIEDNAHGYFTYYNVREKDADATFFSLHKMFPFEKGGSLLLNNNELKNFQFKGSHINYAENLPYNYDIDQISKKRRENFLILEEIIKGLNTEEFFVPLKKGLGAEDVPQTFPIIIEQGDRDKIYQLLNDAGYGVVSLYHTLIEPLRSLEHKEALEVSKKIMNLPVHQDVNSGKYLDMIKLLLIYCESTKKI